MSRKGAIGGGNSENEASDHTVFWNFYTSVDGEREDKVAEIAVLGRK